MLEQLSSDWKFEGFGSDPCSQRFAFIIWAGH